MERDFGTPPSFAVLAMNATLSPTLWILTLAVGYLAAVYLALWAAQRSQRNNKRTFF